MRRQSNLSCLVELLKVTAPFLVQKLNTIFADWLGFDLQLSHVSPRFGRPSNPQSTFLEICQVFKCKVCGIPAVWV